MIVDGSRPCDERFEALYRKYFGQVLRYFIAARGGDGEGQELAQDTFTRVYERIDQIRLDDAGPYVKKTAKSVLLNRIRSRQTRKRTGVMLPMDDPELLSLEPAAPPDVDLADRHTAEARRERLRGAITSLPPGQQECLKLWIQGKTYEEIVKTLNATMDAVKSRLRDAKRTLRERLGETP